MNKFTIALREIGTYKEVLRSQVVHVFFRMSLYTPDDINGVELSCYFKFLIPFSVHFSCNNLVSLASFHVAATKSYD